MFRHQSLDNLPKHHKGAAVALGNFDGVHLGHQSVIALARAATGELDVPLGVITFEPHPRSYFAPDGPSFRLMNADAKAHRLEKIGVEQLYELQFDAALADLSAEAFITEILQARLGVSHLVVGADFRFGKGRSGDAELLEKLGPEHGFGVTIAPLISNSEGDVSSTAIRNALSEGRPRDAERMLGHWHWIEGQVVKGDQRGRDLGFPTANLSLDGLHLPRFGVYAVRFQVLDGPHQGDYLGAASLGERPTFGINAPNLETYVLDFEGDLYGASVSVALVDFLRAEEKYETVDKLVQQIQADVGAVRRVFEQI